MRRTQHAAAGLGGRGMDAQAKGCWWPLEAGQVEKMSYLLQPSVGTQPY